MERAILSLSKCVFGEEERVRSDNAGTALSQNRMVRP
jgi:hypothetical protein